MEKADSGNNSKVKMSCPCIFYIRGSVKLHGRWGKFGINRFLLPSYNIATILFFHSKYSGSLNFKKPVSASSAQKCVTSLFVRLYGSCARIAQNSERYTWLGRSQTFLNTYSAVCTTLTIV